ncbi:hypothetical protein HDV00_005408 [Rhizophlyctis rosea]|nr:hypothetical protein HDV00_005408 [Rhizophlyctis rosea]
MSPVISPAARYEAVMPDFSLSGRSSPTPWMSSPRLSARSPSPTAMMPFNIGVGIGMGLESIPEDRPAAASPLPWAEPGTVGKVQKEGGKDVAKDLGTIEEGEEDE